MSVRYPHIAVDGGLGDSRAICRKRQEKMQIALLKLVHPKPAAMRSMHDRHQARRSEAPAPESLAVTNLNERLARLPKRQSASATISAATSAGT